MESEGPRASFRGYTRTQGCATSFCPKGTTVSLRFPVNVFESGGGFYI